MHPEEMENTITLMRYYYQEASETITTLGEWDTNSMINSIRQRTITPGQAWLNLYDGDRPVGMISGGISTAPWNDTIIYSTIEMFYILKSHRNMDRFRSLVKGFEEFSAQCSAEQIYVSDMGMDESRTRTLYEQLGYTSATSLVKRI
jgi:hypothetical protein